MVIPQILCKAFFVKALNGFRFPQVTALDFEKYD
jgi:hypothetical protein